MVNKKFLPAKIDGKTIVKTIKQSDPLDLAIWKLMSDGKRRTNEEIRIALKEYGFTQEEVGERVRVLFCSSNRRWFDSQGKGNRTTYQLRKNRLERPFARGGVSIDSIADISDILVITEEAGKMSTLVDALGNTPTGKPPFEDLHKAAFVSPPLSEKSMQLDEALSSPEVIEATEDKLKKEVEMNTESKNQENKSDIVEMTTNEGIINVKIYTLVDSLEVKILRVMKATNLMFSIKDLSEILSVDKKQIGYRLRKLVKLGVLSRVDKPAVGASDWVFYYLGDTQDISPTGMRLLHAANLKPDGIAMWEYVQIDPKHYHQKPDDTSLDEESDPTRIKSSDEEQLASTLNPEIAAREMAIHYSFIGISGIRDADTASVCRLHNLRDKLLVTVNDEQFVNRWISNSTTGLTVEGAISILEDPETLTQLLGEITKPVELSGISEEENIKILDTYLKARSEMRPMFPTASDSITINYDTKPKIVIRGVVLTGNEAREIKTFVEGISSLSGDSGIPSVMKDASIEIQGRQYTFTDIEDIGIELMALFD